MTPLKAIRQYCIFCMNNQITEITKCTDKKCPLFNYRMNKNMSDPRISECKIIKKYCLSCGEGTHSSVRNCAEKECSLHPFRLGKNPNLTGCKGNTEALSNWRMSLKNK